MASPSRESECAPLVDEVSAPSVSVDGVRQRRPARKAGLHHISESPQWMRNNQYITDFYRPQLCLKGCFLSLFQVHNETANCWTHLIGTILFFFITLHTMDWMWEHDREHKVVFLIYIFSAIACFTASTIFHLFRAHSDTTHKLLARLDYSGIAIMVAGSMVPLLYYGFACEAWLRNVYCTVALSLGAACCAFNVLPGFDRGEYRVFRTGMFLAFGFSGAVPVLHKVLLHGGDSIGLPYLLAMASFYTGGALLYASRIPERFFPDKSIVMVWLHSHCIFHVAVVAAALVHFRAVVVAFEHRLANPCPT
eukprot:tig00020684_g12904.t1